MSWEKVKTTNMWRGGHGKPARWTTREMAKQSAKRRRRRQDKQEARDG